MPASETSTAWRATESAHSLLRRALALCVAVRPFDDVCGGGAHRLATVRTYAKRSTRRVVQRHVDRRVGRRLPVGAGDGSSRGRSCAAQTDSPERRRPHRRPGAQIAPAQLDTRKALGAMGLNSLMAMELRNRLETVVGRPLSATLAWNYPDRGRLVEFLAGFGPEPSRSKPSAGRCTGRSTMPSVMLPPCRTKKQRWHYARAANGCHEHEVEHSARRHVRHQAGTPGQANAGAVRADPARRSHRHHRHGVPRARRRHSR